MVMVSVPTLPTLLLVALPSRVPVALFQCSVTVSVAPKPLPLALTRAPGNPEAGLSASLGWMLTVAVACRWLLWPTAVSVCAPNTAAGTLALTVKEPLAVVVVVVSTVVLAPVQNTSTVSFAPKAVPVMESVWPTVVVSGLTARLALGTGVLVGVLVGGTGVFVGVLVGGMGVFVGVLVGGTGVLVGVFVAWADAVAVALALEAAA